MRPRDADQGKTWLSNGQQVYESQQQLFADTAVRAARQQGRGRITTTTPEHRRLFAARAHVGQPDPASESIPGLSAQ